MLCAAKFVNKITVRTGIDKYLLRFSGHASLCFVHKCETNDGMELFILDASCRLGFVETGNNLIMCGKKNQYRQIIIF